MNAPRSPDSDAPRIANLVDDPAARQLVLEELTRLRHALNNPLAALLAEAQLLELEAITDEQRKSVERMVALCRRMVAIVRALDSSDHP
ncbi:MAG TPA: histidine kinase dimerization/phospho-acceptor domain-containing protein [Gemmatimonadaceae bacterium]|nr:histidine kinase dimerization/phospho-acceptor domain-containing protein [Gemmatimonadaceae bacterium]